MPIKQLPIFTPRGVYAQADDLNSEADLPFYINGYFEKVETSETESRRFVYKMRPGLTEQWNAQALANNYKVQGVCANQARTLLLVFANNGAANKVYTVSTTTTTDKGAAPAAAGSWTNTGPVVFTALDGISYGATVYYAVTDFTKGAMIDVLGNWTEITSATFTGLSKCTNIVGLDGYLFVGTTDNRIYNSNLNASATWVSTSFLTADDTPGSIMWLAKIRQFLIAFKENSIEFFEDVGNPTPGSPLEARKNYNVRIGCINRSTIQEVSDGIIFAGKAGSGAPKLYKIMRDSLQIKVVSDRLVDQCLTNGYTSSVTYSNDSLASLSVAGQSQVFNVLGKEFYTLNLPDPGGTNASTTQVYDNDLGVWTAWHTSIVTANTPDTYGFHGSQAAMINATSIGTLPVFVDNTSVAAGVPARFLLMNPTGFNDVSSSLVVRPYTMSWVSDVYDFGGRHRKFMDSIEVLYTMLSSATPSPSSTRTMTLMYRDWDYVAAAGYTVTKTLRLDAGSAVRAMCTQLGSFRRRNFALKYENSAATPRGLSIWGVELRLNEGETDQDT